ncbi:TraB/GumN family protein [Chitinibacter tainanensis]|uniref:TraB/GumN family protein n=1 Tax=Chitinibacter tainanensis TaxID=230667 RepID=UPI002355AD10|nr:TraB/GumN family protein [Chitinibacter tainanensis]
MRLKQLAVALLAVCGLAATAQAAVCPNPIPTPLTPAQLAKVGSERGFLWRISHGKTQSYLYGTIHANRVEGSALGPQVRSALQASRQLVLELDLDDASVSQQLLAGMQGKANVPAAVKARYQAQLARLCLPNALLEQLDINFLMVTLTLLDAQLAGVEGSYGTENVLLQLAKQRQLPVKGLETVAEQLAALKDDGELSLAQHEQALTMLENGHGRQQLLKLVDVWNRRDWATMSQYRSWCECENTAEDRAAMVRLLDERNPRMAQRIDALLREGQANFIAVGSLHLVGEHGLPNLLRQLGYKVEPVSLPAASK